MFSVSTVQRRGECPMVFHAFGRCQITTKTVAKATESSTINIGMDATRVVVKTLCMPLTGIAPSRHAALTTDRRVAYHRPYASSCTRGHRRWREVSYPAF